MQGAQLYVTGEPCGGCWKMIKGAGIKDVIWPGGHWINPQLGFPIQLFNVNKRK
jgi:hypothetical protein